MSGTFQSSWLCNKGKKKLNAFFNQNFFPENRERITWDAIETMCDVMAEYPNSKEGRLVKEYLERIRIRFRNLSQEDFKRVLRSFYCAGRKEGSNDQYCIPFKFEVANTLGYTRHGDYTGAKIIFEKTLLAVRSLPAFNSKNKECDEIICAIKFLFSIIAEVNITHTLNNLIESAFSGDTTAKNILQDILVFPYFHCYGVKLIPVSQWPISLKSREVTGKDILDSVGYGSSSKIIKFPVPDGKEEFIISLMRKLEADAIEKNSAMQNILTFFRQHFSKFSDLFSKMWDEIQVPKHAIRTAGKDRVELKITSLQKKGFKTIQFFSEGCNFPHVRVKFWLEGFSHLSNNYYSFVISLDQSDLRLYSKQDLSEDNEMVWSIKLLAFISFHSYWRIITGKDDKVELREDSSNDSIDITFQDWTKHGIIPE